MTRRSKLDTDDLIALRILRPPREGRARNAKGVLRQGQPLPDAQGAALPDPAPLPAREPMPVPGAIPASADHAQPQRTIKGHRGIDTLLRNAYRAQLDMLALAATKANIMISLNGLLMSMLIISGTHFVSINQLYVVPISLLLLTCASATVFAVFSARPDVSTRQYSRADFETDQAHLLVFEEFSDLDEAEYVETMAEMLSDRQRVYRNMIAHIHELGVTADRKYRQLYYSYTLFMGGVIMTVTSLLALQLSAWLGAVSLA